MSNRKQQVIAFGANGDVSGDVAPDLGEVYGTQQRVSNKLKSSNPVVQNDLVADAKQRLWEAMGVEPEESLLKTFSDVSPDLQHQFLTAMRTAADAVRNNAKSITVTNNLAAHSSNALNNLTNQLAKAKELVERIERCEHGLDNVEAKLQSANESWSQERRKEDADLDELRKASDELHDKVDKKIIEAETSIEKFSIECQEKVAQSLKQFVDENKSSCEGLQLKLKDMLARATVATLSSKFEEKRKSLNLKYILERASFYACLMGFCVVGLCAVSSARSLGGDEIWVRIIKAILNETPLALPLFWLTCHINKLMNQDRRLMEEYAHKVVVAQTYTGMAKQVEELANKGVVSAKDLSEDLMSSTIRVLCANPNSALDKVKTQTPLSEVAECVSKLANAVSVVRNQPPKPNGNE